MFYKYSSLFVVLGLLFSLAAGVLFQEISNLCIPRDPGAITFGLDCGGERSYLIAFTAAGAGAVFLFMGARRLVAGKSVSEAKVLRELLAMVGAIFAAALLIFAGAFVYQMVSEPAVFKSFLLKIS